MLPVHSCRLCGTRITVCHPPFADEWRRNWPVVQAIDSRPAPATALTDALKRLRPEALRRATLAHAPWLPPEALAAVGIRNKEPANNSDDDSDDPSSTVDRRRDSTDTRPPAIDT